MNCGGRGTVGDMSTAALADLTDIASPAARQRAAKTVDAALRGGILAGAVAAIAWLLAVALGSTVFFLLVIGTVLALIYTVMRGDKARRALGPDRDRVGARARRALGGQQERRHHRRRRGLARRRRRRAARGDREEVAGAPALSADLAGDRDRRQRERARPVGRLLAVGRRRLGPVLGVRTMLNPSPRDHSATAWTGSRRRSPDRAVRTARPREHPLQGDTRPAGGRGTRRRARARRTPGRHG